MDKESLSIEDILTGMKNDITHAVKETMRDEGLKLREDLEEIIEAKINIKLEPIKEKLSKLLLYNFKVIIGVATVMSIAIAVFQLIIFFSSYLN